MTKQLRQTLVVTRFGELDEEWLAALEAEQRREELVLAGKHVLAVAGQVGKLLLASPALFVEHVKNS